MINATSVKDRLKNQATASGRAFQELLLSYGLERTVYRLSMSEYKERFTLKGGIFLYALFDGEFARATRDIDFLAKDMSNSVEDMKKVFEAIFSIECDDALRFDLGTLDVKDITEFKEYHGVSVSIIAYLDRTKVPVLLDMEVPEIFAYSISSVISEKFEAIVSLGDANSRYKDFYDIFILADRYDFDGIELKEAIRETFEHRGTGFDDIFAFTDDFLVSEIHQSRWKAFLKKKKALVNVELEKVVSLIKTMLLPIVESIVSGTEYTSKWDHTLRSWK